MTVTEGVWMMEKTGEDHQVGADPQQRTRRIKENWHQLGSGLERLTITFHLALTAPNGRGLTRMKDFVAREEFDA